MMRLIPLTAVVLSLAACVEQKVRKAEVDLSKMLSPDCYTVDLFDPAPIQYPVAEVTPEQRAFLGVWKQGAWNGLWCHDLHVTEVFPDGTATVMDLYGPNLKTEREATAFRRTAHIKDGVMTVSHGRAAVQYRLVGDYLVGQRIDTFGKYEITMSREVGLAEVPIPPKRSS